MSAARFAEVVRREVVANARRPMYYVLLAIIIYLSWLYAQGDVYFQGGSTRIGGKEVWLNSEFFISWWMAALTFAFYSFFICIAAGLTVIRDDELTPRSLSGLQLWVRADAGLELSASRVTAWRDQSGLLEPNDLIQARGVHLPGWTASAANGLPALRLDAVASR